MSFSVFLVSFLTWLLLTWSLDPAEIAIGLLVSFVVSVVFQKYYGIRFGPKALLGSFKFLLIYVPVFVWEMVKANFDVGSRVLSGDLGLKPGFVRIKTSLKDGIAKLTLANSITLTPGTITLDIEGDELLVHWIEVRGTDDASKKLVYGRFERVLKGVFE